MRRFTRKLTRTAPFLRLLIALLMGIVVQYYTCWPTSLLLFIALAGLALTLLYPFLRPSLRYRIRWMPGLGIHLLLANAGAWLVYTKDISHKKHWLGNREHQFSAFDISITETPQARPSSWKTTAVVNAGFINSRWHQASGNILVYFSKQCAVGRIGQGTRLILRHQLQQVNSTRNPGAFDYKAYCAAQGIYHQVYLTEKDFIVIDSVQEYNFQKLLSDARENTLALLRHFIPGKKEAGVAEALLIGYRNDLDKNTVLAYSNTGVVHIIAISGLHLGMIYGLLVSLFRPFRKRKWSGLVCPLLILIVLWTFTLLTGAAASILRSAVMFSFIVIGELLNRKTRIYNTLAASAFCLLIYDPNLLWDVGFQLSYAAVVSIIIFQQPLYRKIFVRNKLLRMIWELNSITLAAQILTLPLILYYFHQFPNLFLFTNFIAVPLSGIILYAELLLLMICRIAVLSISLGRFISVLIFQMNSIIERTARIPFGITDNISCSLFQAFALYVFITAMTCWLFHRKKAWLFSGLVSALIFITTRAGSSILNKGQHLLVVYNVPKKQAIDIYEGQRFYFTSSSPPDAAAIQLHLRPGRILRGVLPGRMLHTCIGAQLVQTAHKKVILANGGLRLTQFPAKRKVDAVILGGNNGYSINQLANLFDCPQYVFDSSVPLWKIRKWKKQADSLHLRHHSVPELGAFQMAL